MFSTRSSLHSYLTSVNPPSHELVAGVALVARLTALLDQFPEQVLDFFLYIFRKHGHAQHGKNRNVKENQCRLFERASDENLRLEAVSG